MADDNSNNIGWFLAGMGLGALVGILFAPKSGRETREQILEGAVQGRDWAVARGREAREQATQWVDKSREQATQFVDKSKESATQWVEKGKEAVTRQKEQINAAIEAGRSAYREAAVGTTENK